jgi:hypothetical protein
MGPRTVRPDTDRLALYYGPSGNFVQQKSTDKKDRTKSTQEHAKNTTNCWLKATSRTIRQGRADSSPNPTS